MHIERFGDVFVEFVWLMDELFRIVGYLVWSGVTVRT
jgi:hypothetical protein